MMLSSMCYVPFCRVAPPHAGPSPQLVFNVDDVQESLTRLLQLGAHMEGKVHYAVDGQKASVPGISNCLCCASRPMWLTE